MGVDFKGEIVPLTMKFNHRGDEVVYCVPDEEGMGNLELIAHAASINVEPLYPMSGLETEEPVLQPGRIDVLLGQGQTAQVLRNLCLMVAASAPEDWKRVVALMKRLFLIELGTPIETSRGAIELSYRQPGVKDELDVSLAGRGFQQMLLIFSYLYSHKKSVLLVDEPDAHLEILRQKQVYVLLRDIATDNQSQVVIVTHSEVILDEALDKNLTLLLDGRADDLAQKADIRNSLKHFGASHYVKARERGYVFYVEGGTDVDILRAFAEKMAHPVALIWDERINSFYVQSNYPEASMDSELERVEGGFGVTPREHFKGLRELLPELKGLAILDNDGRGREPRQEGALQIAYWRRYEAENYFVSPELLRKFALAHYEEMELFEGFRLQIDEVLNGLTLDQVFAGNTTDFHTWQSSPLEAARLIWEAKTERLKMSRFAEEFFRRLAAKVGQQMLLRKGELHRLIQWAAVDTFPPEVTEKLNMLQKLFENAKKLEEVNANESE